MPEGAVVESTPVETGAQTQVQAAAADTGTPDSQGGQATSQAQSAPTEDSFSNIDPKALPPELQGVYKNLQADYTRKTQGIAETRKKAEAYDYVSKDQRFVDYWNDMSRSQKADFKEQKEEVEKRLGEKVSDEEFAKAFNSKDDFLSFLERIVQDRSMKSQKEIDSLKQELSVNKAADIVDSFATAKDENGQALRADFYKLDEDQLITGFLTVNPPQEKSESAYAAKLNEAYTWAKTVTQKYYEKGRNDAMARIQQKAANSSEPPTGSAKTTTRASDAKNWSVREAIERAKKGERVSQVYD